MIFNLNKNKMAKKIIILFSLISSINVFSQDAGDAKVTRPMLNGHKFVVNNFVSSPFVNTFFRNTLGFGQAVDLNVPILYIDGEPVAGLRGDISFLTVDFEYQYAINNWAGIFGKIGLLTRFGTEAQSLVAQGLNASYGMELGWLFNVYKSKKVVISLTANLWNKSGTVLDLYDFVKEIIDSSGLTEDNNLLYSHDYVQGGGGIRMAWAPKSYLGVNGLFELAYGESIDNVMKNELYYKLGLSVDYDIRAHNPDVPLGFSLGAVLDSFARSDDSAVDDNSIVIFFRTAYTGRDDLLISFDMDWSRLPLSTVSERLKTMTGLITIEYYF